MFKISTEGANLAFDELLGVSTELCKRGFKISDSIREAIDGYSELADKYARKLATEYGINNANSPKQLQAKLKQLADCIPAGDKNIIVAKCYDPDTRKWTSSAEALEALSDNGITFASYVLSYRDATKRTQVLEALLEAEDFNGVVHPHTELNATGRVSFSSPAIMSIHKDMLWDVLEPMNEGDGLFSVDIKNQEPHIIIELTQCESLKPALVAEEGVYEYMMHQAFKPTVTLNIIRDKSLSEENTRIYAEQLPAKYNLSLCTTEKAKTNGYFYKDQRVVAFETFCYNIVDDSSIELPKTATVMLENKTIADVDVEWEIPVGGIKGTTKSIKGNLNSIEFRVLKTERKEFKTCWIAMGYGGGYNAVADACCSLDPHTVYNFISNIDGIKRYRNLCKKHAASSPKYVKTAFGTKIPLGNVNRHQLEKFVMNYPIQGTGADILKCLIRHFNFEVMKRGLDKVMSLYLTRHDEVVIEVDKKYLDSHSDEEVSMILRDIFEHQVNDWQPFKIEINRVD